MHTNLARLFIALLFLLLIGGRGEGASGPQHPLSITADFNGDGKRDWATAASDGIGVQLSHAPDHRRLIVPFARDIVGLAAGDIDADGDPDFVALRSTGQPIVCRNDGGRFTRVTLDAAGASLSTAQPRLSAPETDPGGPLESATSDGLSIGGLPGGRRLPHLDAAELLLPPCCLVPCDSIVHRRSPRSPPLLPLA